jgi:hypothetical protein
MLENVTDRVIVTAADDQVGHLDELAGRLGDAGMVVERVLSIGVITGTLLPERRPVVTAMAGVAAVEDEVTFSTPPPPSDIQ